MKRAPLSIIVLATIASVFAATALARHESRTPTSQTQAQLTCVQQTTQIVNEARKPLPFIGPPSRVNMANLRGKTLWIVSIDTTPWVQEGVDGFMQALKAIGAKGKFFDSKGNITLANQGIDTAIAQKAAGIAIWAIDPRNVSAKLLKAQAAGIPVIDINAATVSARSANPTQFGIFGHVGTDWDQVGTWFADYMLAKTNCKLNALVLSIKTLPFVVTAQKATQREIAKRCPSCKARVIYIDLAKLATSLGPQVQTAVNADPGINYIDALVDVFAQLIEPALLQAGKKIPMISHDGARPTFKNIRSGGLSAATITTAYPSYWGWAFVDQLGRAINKQKPARWSLRNRIIDKTNIGKNDAQLFPKYANLEKGFLKGWGVT